MLSPVKAPSVSIVVLLILIVTGILSIVVLVDPSETRQTALISFGIISGAWACLVLVRRFRSTKRKSKKYNAIAILHDIGEGRVTMETQHHFIQAYEALDH